MSVAIDWHQLLTPSRPLAELVLRSTVMYLLLFLALRFLLKRQSAGLEISDLLVIVLIADAAQNGMIGEVRCTGEGRATGRRWPSERDPNG